MCFSVLYSRFLRWSVRAPPVLHATDVAFVPKGAPRPTANKCFLSSRKERHREGMDQGQLSQERFLGMAICPFCCRNLCAGPCPAGVQGKEEAPEMSRPCHAPTNNQESRCCRDSGLQGRAPVPATFSAFGNQPHVDFPCLSAH